MYKNDRSMTMLSQSQHVSSSGYNKSPSTFDTSKMSMSQYSSMKVYCAPPQEVAHKLRAGEQGLNCISFSPFGSQLATAGDDNLVRVWDVDGNESKSFKPFLCPLSSVVFNSNGNFLAVAGTDDQIGIISRKPNLSMRTKFSGHSDCINSLHFDRANKHVLSGSADRSVRIWDI